MTLIQAVAPVLAAPAQQGSLRVRVRAAPVLREAVRILTGFAGLGAASVGFGLSSNFVYVSAAPDGIAVPAALSSSAELSFPAVLSFTAALAVGVWAMYLAVWSVQTLRSGRILLPHSTIALLSAGSMVCLLAVIRTVWLADGPDSVNVTVVSLAALQLIMLSALGYLRRTASSAAQANSSPSAGRLLLALFAAAIVVAAVATPGLAATTAGEFAVPHGEHAVPGVDEAELAQLDQHRH